MNNLTWFIKQSLRLDYKFLKASDWHMSKKINFLTLKYYLIIKHFVKQFEIGKSNTLFSNENIYYDSRYGLAGYQSILARHQRLIKLAKIHNVKTVVDIGANVGFFSKLCRQLFPKAQIYSIEPIPKIAECLKNNFKNDNLTKIFNVAISDEKGVVRMEFDKNDSAVSKISKKGNVEISAETLNDFVKKNKIKQIDILKIDTETFEAHVLRGADYALAKTRYLFIEVTMRNNKNYTMSSLMKLLNTEKYDFQLVGFRNYADTDEGEMPIMDALLLNTHLK